MYFMAAPPHRPGLHLPRRMMPTPAPRSRDDREHAPQGNCRGATVGTVKVRANRRRDRPHPTSNHVLSRTSRASSTARACTTRSATSPPSENGLETPRTDTATLVTLSRNRGIAASSHARFTLAGARVARRLAAGENRPTTAQDCASPGRRCAGSSRPRPPRPFEHAVNSLARRPARCSRDRCHISG